MPADIAARAGRLLEEMLKPLCEKLRISVPFREAGRYDLGTLWPPILSKCREHKGFAAVAETTLDEIDRSDWVRNAVGAHANISPSVRLVDLDSVFYHRRSVEKRLTAGSQEKIRFHVALLGFDTGKIPQGFAHFNQRT